jgi:hypothetical protein
VVIYIGIQIKEVRTMEIIIDKLALVKARRVRTFQDELPERIKCSKCGINSRNIMIIDDLKGELANQDIKRVEGIPIHPHDSCVFALYMCTECGHVDVIWNQG